jgi:hypothetical protein
MPSQLVKQRAQKYIPPWRTSERKFKFVPRNSELRKLEGYYNLASDNPLLNEYERYKKSGGKIAFSKWLINYKGVTDPSKICKKIAEESHRVKLTCQYNDILRMSDTRSFKACTQPGQMGAKTVKIACEHPDFGMLVVAGPSGHFNGRIGFTLKDKKVQLFRAYGVVSIEAAENLFKQLGYEVSQVLGDMVCDLTPVKKLHTNIN